MGKNRAGRGENPDGLYCSRGGSGCAGILGPVIGFGQEGFTVTIYGAGASIFDGVMGSVRDHGLSGIIRLTNFYFLRFSGLIVCTMAMAAVLGFLFPGTRGK